MKDKLKVLALELFNSGLTIGTVEHCTSGLLGASISSLCGLTKIYGGTIVTVDEERMEKLADVSSNVFKTNGLISSQVACQMALGGLYKLNVDVCVSIVGDVSSSSGENKIWICVATMKEKKIDFKYEKMNVKGFRGENIESAIIRAIDTTIEEIKRVEIEGV